METSQTSSPFPHFQPFAGVEKSPFQVSAKLLNIDKMQLVVEFDNHQQFHLQIDCEIGNRMSGRQAV